MGTRRAAKRRPRARGRGQDVPTPARNAGPGGEQVDRSAWTISIYGTISVAVIVAEYASSSPGRLALLLMGYGASLWLAHGYAGVVSGAYSRWSPSLRHAWPVAEAALPALAVVGPAALLGWSNRVAVPLALVACLINLVAVQIAVLRRAGRRSPARVAATVALDLVAGAVVLVTLTLLR
jgi:hypothetical protein